jgi:hypothetical protein
MPALNRALRRLTEESGVALLAGLMVLTTLTITATSVVYFTSSSARTSAIDRSRQVAFALAEAGIHNSMAVLSQPPPVSALSQNTLPACTANPTANWNHSTYDGGTVDWCGDFSPAQAGWNLTGLGRVPNPSGADEIVRRARAFVAIKPVVSQLNNALAWNYIFATQTGSTCDMTLNENMTMESALYVYGNLCLDNNANVRVGPLIVVRRLSLSNNGTVGTSSGRIEVSVDGYDTGSGVLHCKKGNGAFHYGCGDSDNVFSKLSDGTPGVSLDVDHIEKPDASWDLWYEDAMPGPKVGCTSQSGSPPTWDTDYPARNNNVTPAFNLTPSTSYECRVGPAEDPLGELSWNASTRTLTVRGVMFLDGSAYSNNGLLNGYNGRGSLYLSGTFLLDNNTKLCGISSGSNCSYDTWNANEELLTIIADGNGGQVPAGSGIQLDNNSQWQGGLYATNGITLSNNSHSDGPMIGGTIIITQNFSGDDFGKIEQVPPGMPGNPQVYAKPQPPRWFGD